MASSPTEIEEAISGLDREGFSRVEAWFDEYRNRLWDRQIEEDSTSGAMDHLLREIDSEIAAGKVRPADEILDDRDI